MVLAKTLPLNVQGDKGESSLPLIVSVVSPPALEHQTLLSLCTNTFSNMRRVTTHVMDGKPDAVF